jgi:hypothetical protein
MDFCQSVGVFKVKKYGSLHDERADVLGGMAAERSAWSPVTSLAFLKLQISEKFRKSKEA